MKQLIAVAGILSIGAFGNTAEASYSYVEGANILANQDIIVDQSANPSAYNLVDTITRQEALKIMMRLSGLKL